MQKRKKCELEKSPLKRIKCSREKREEEHKRKRKGSRLEKVFERLQKKSGRNLEEKW